MGMNKGKVVGRINSAEKMYIHNTITYYHFCYNVNINLMSML